MGQNEELTAKTAVVTGASSGIGRAIAERLGAAGAHVVLGGRTEGAMAESAERIRAAGGSATCVAGDVRDPATIRAMIAAAVEGTGRLDIFVNNAGVMWNHSILDGNAEEWRAMLETNVLALLVGCTEAIRAMRSTASTGRIVNVSSVAALDPSSGVYGATKHAVNVISDTLRLELIDDPIQITTIMPGVIATNMARTFDPEVIRGLVSLTGIEADITPGERIPDEVLEAAQAALSDFIARPEDIADAVYYAVTQPARVHVAQIVVRPNKDLDF